MFLKTSVEEAAAEALRSFRTIGTDYSSAWEALCRRFDQPKLQVQDHFMALVKLNPREEESPVGLLTLLDEINKHRTQLAKLGRPVENWDDWFVFLGSQALDSLTRRV